jgi:hypothetical protein
MDADKVIETPIEFMIELNWDEETLNRAIKFLGEWDKRTHEFYKNYKNIHKNFDHAQREHYRNCVNFWKTRLKYEVESI